VRVPKYFGSSDTNYIICINVEIFKNKKTLFKQQNFVEDNKDSFEMFKKILFFNMESSKLIIQHTHVLKLCLDYGITNQYSIPGREKGKVL
jgi:hypothetical protein